MPPVHAKPDQCVIGARNTLSGGEPNATYAYTGGSIRCRFTRSVNTKEVAGGSRLAVTDIAIHLPNGTVVTNQNRIELTRRNRATLTPSEFYQIVGQPFEPISGDVVVNCQRISGSGSAN